MTNPMHNIEHSLHNLASPKRGHTFWGMVLVVCVAGALLWLRHGEWLGDPNSCFIGESPDGIKNYMTTAWHVRHDTTLVHCGGMNFPFGEHALFTDNQPIFAATLQWWHRNIGPIADRTVGVMNLFLVASILLGAAVQFLLLRKLHLPVWFAGLVALGMTFLTPQYGRFDGHFGLSHTFVIPGLLLLLCRYEERQSRRYQSLLIGIFIWFSAQLHFYYFGMAALFLSLYMAFQVLRDFSWRNVRVRFPHWVVMVLLPFAALNLWLHWADYASDRPASPWGFTTNIGSWEGVFLPYENWPLHGWIDRNITKIRPVVGEAKAYAGVVAFVFTLVVLVWAVVRRLRNLLKIRQKNLSGWATTFKLFPSDWDDMAHHRVHKNYLRGIFAAAFGLLLFACGFPFAIKGLEWTADWLGPLRQFRGLGRFTWAYFYVANLLAFYLIWNHTHHAPQGWLRRWFDRLSGPKLTLARNFLAVLPVVVLCWEGFYFQKTKKIARINNPLLTQSETQTEEMPWLRKVDFSRFQAILPLPYYHIGSENVWLDFGYDHFRLAQYTAYLTGLPDMGVNMSRTSIGQTVKSLQLTLRPGEPPAMLAALPDDRPLALFVWAEKWDEVQNRYGHLLEKAAPVYTGEKIRILSLEPESLPAIAREHAEAAARQMEAARLAEIPRTAWRATQPGAPFFHNSCDSLADAKFVFQGKGAFSGRMHDTTWLFRGNWPQGEQTLSFWVRAVADMGMNHALTILETSPDDGHEIRRTEVGTTRHIQSIVGEWALVEVPFEVQAEGSRLAIYLHRTDAKNRFWLDEIMLRPRALEVFRRENGWLGRDNHYFKL